MIGFIAVASLSALSSKLIDDIIPILIFICLLSGALIYVLDMLDLLTKFDRSWYLLRGDISILGGLVALLIAGLYFIKEHLYNFNESLHFVLRVKSPSPPFFCPYLKHFRD